MKKTITEVETAIENRIAELEEEYELDIYDRNDIREEEYQKAGWRHDPFPEELEEEDEEEDSTKERHTPYFPNVMYRYEVGFTCRDMIPTFGMNQQVNVTREYYVDTGNGRGESRERNVVVCRGLQN